MNSAHVTEANLAALSVAKYHKWLRGENGIPDRDRRLRDLKSRDLQFGGWAHGYQAIWEDFLVRGARQQIKLYKRTGRAAGCPGMFAKQRLDELRQLIMTGASHAVMTIKGQIAMAANATGKVSPTLLGALLAEPLYVQMQSRILNIVNAELGVLEAEGRLGLADVPSEAPASSGDADRGSPSNRRRGPKPDYDNAARVASVVARVASHGDWRSKVDVICEALDSGTDIEGEPLIPCPKKWRREDKTCKQWSDQLDGPKVIKAIEYRLKTANQRNKVVLETLS